MLDILPAESNCVSDSFPATAIESLRSAARQRGTLRPRASQHRARIGRILHRSLSVSAYVTSRPYPKNNEDVSSE